LSSLLTKFNKEVIGSSGRIFDYLAKVSPAGDFERTRNLATILTSWNNILLTPTRSNTFDPEYGCEIYKYVFEPLDDTTIEEIKDEIMYRLMLYDDRADITNIEVGTSNDKKSLNISITVSYEGEEGEISAVIDKNTYLKLLE